MSYLRCIYLREHWLEKTHKRWKPTVISELSYFFYCFIVITYLMILPYHIRNGSHCTWNIFSNEIYRHSVNNSFWWPSYTVGLPTGSLQGLGLEPTIFRLGVNQLNPAPLCMKQGWNMKYVIIHSPETVLLLHHQPVQCHQLGTSLPFLNFDWLSWRSQTSQPLYSLYNVSQNTGLAPLPKPPSCNQYQYANAT